MKHSKHIILCVIAIISMFIAVGTCLTSCSDSTVNAKSETVVIGYVDTVRLPGGVYIDVVEDNETDVEYIIFMSREGVTCTPRYNSDGTLYTGR